MGGGTPSQPAPPPAPPSVGETSAQAIQAQIDALPKILASQKEFGPQFSELSLEQLRKFGPEFAKTALDLQSQFGPKYKEIQDQLNPEVAAAQKSLTDFLSQTEEQEYQALRPGLLEDVRAAQSVRGIGAISPLGSIDESVQLQRLRQSLKDRRVNVALSTAGRVPISGVPQLNPTSGVGQLVQNISPQSIFEYAQNLNNFNASIFNTQSDIYGTTYNNVTARRGQNTALIGQGISALGSVGASAAAPATKVGNFFG